MPLGELLSGLSSAATLGSKAWELRLWLKSRVRNRIDCDRSFMHVPPTTDDKWIARILFAKSGGPVQVRLDFSCFPEAVGQIDWTKPKSLLFQTIPIFVKGQDIAVHIMERDDTQGNPIWHWCTPERQVILTSMHRCRLVLLTDKREIGDFSFVIVHSKGGRPNLLCIGENHFTYAARWRASARA